MCAACDAWTAERHDPAWKAPKGVRQVGRAKRPRYTPAERRQIRQGMAPGSV